MKKLYGSYLFFEDFITYLSNVKAIYISDTVIPFFKKIQSNENAKYPILMDNINSDLFCFKPEDNNASCIYFEGNKFIIIESLFKDNFKIEIPISKIEHKFTLNFNTETYISLRWIEDEVPYEVSFDACTMPEVQESFGNYFFVKEFINTLQKLNT